MTYCHVSHAERRVIITMYRAGQSKAAIARALIRHPSTIGRELTRNQHHNGQRRYYTHSKAHQKAQERRKACRKHSHFTAAQWMLVESLILQDWSPEQIANTLRKEGRLTISHETIYHYIYADKRGGGNLHTHLRLRSKKQRKRYGTYERRGILQGKRTIDQRPIEAETREEPGHWEIDTVLGKGSKHCIVTLVERMTGYVFIGKMPNRTKEALNAAVIAIMSRHHKRMKTVTSDNGTEFHGYKEIEQRTGTTFYFATPHHAWERGTNENTNGLIRQYIPKYTSMRRITQEDCDKIAEKLNMRPRKRLGFRTPKEAYEFN